MSYEIETFNPEIFAAIENERARQIDYLEMIAFDNFILPAMMGSIFTNVHNLIQEANPMVQS